MFSLKQVRIGFFCSLCVVVIFINQGAFADQHAVHESNQDLVVTPPDDVGWPGESGDVVKDDGTNKVTLAVEGDTAESDASGAAVSEDLRVVDVSVASGQIPDVGDSGRPTDNPAAETEVIQGGELPNDTGAGNAGTCDMTEGGEGTCLSAGEDAPAADATTDHVPASVSPMENSPAIDSAFEEDVGGELVDSSPTAVESAEVDDRLRDPAEAGDTVAAALATEDDEAASSAKEGGEKADPAREGDETVSSAMEHSEITVSTSGDDKVIDSAAEDETAGSATENDEGVDSATEDSGMTDSASRNDKTVDPAMEDDESTDSAMGEDRAIGSTMENDEAAASAMGDTEMADIAAKDETDYSAAGNDIARDSATADGASLSVELSVSDVAVPNDVSVGDDSDSEGLSGTNVEALVDAQEERDTVDPEEDSGKGCGVPGELDDATKRLLAESKEALHAVSLELETAVLELETMSLELETAKRHASDYEADLHSAHAEISSLKHQSLMFEREMQLLVDLIDAAGGKEAVPRLQGDAKAAVEKMEQFEADAKDAREESQAIQSDLEVAQRELKKLSDMLSLAETDVKEGKRFADELRKVNEELKWELSDMKKELEEAWTPKEVSVSVTAIMADVKKLGRDVTELVTNFRDEVVLAVKVEVVKIREFLEPRWKAAVDVAAPWVEKGLEVSAPHRAYAMEFVGEYCALWKREVAPRIRQHLSKAQIMMKSNLRKVSRKCNNVQDQIMRQLKRLGLDDVEARRVMKYMNIAGLSILAIVSIVYLGGTLLRYLVLPVVRLAARVLLWLLKLPFRILWLPAWLLLCCFRLVFRRSSRGSSRKKASAVTGTSKRKNRNKNKRE